MGSDNLLGILAIATLAIVIIFALYHFSSFLRSPSNRDSAHNALVRDEKSATAVEREGGGHPATEGRTLKERLDGSPASAHPTTPEQSQSRG